MDLRKTLSLLGAISIASIATPDQVSATPHSDVEQIVSSVSGVQITTLHKSLSAERKKNGHYSHSSHSSHVSHASHSSHTSARW